MDLTPTVNQAQTMPFYLAIKEIKNGKKVRRLSWVGDYCYMKDGWLVINTNKEDHNWSINDGDIEGEDWVVVKEGN
jgi:hypothetical protein